MIRDYLLIKKCYLDILICKEKEVLLLLHCYYHDLCSHLKKCKMLRMGNLIRLLSFLSRRIDHGCHHILLLGFLRKECLILLLVDLLIFLLRFLKILRLDIYIFEVDQCICLPFFFFFF